MLAQGSKPMNRVRCSGTSMVIPTLRRASSLAVLLIAGLVSGPELMVAQNSLEANDRVTPTAAQADFSIGASKGSGLFSISAFPDLPGTGLGIRAFGQPQAGSTTVTGGLAFNPVAWDRRLPGPSQPPRPWLGTAKFGDFATGSIGLTGIGRQQGSGSDQFAGRGLGGPQVNFPSLFPGAGTLPRNQVGGTTLSTPPRFDARISSAFTLPLSSGVDTFRLSYRDMLGDGKNAMVGNYETGSGSATFGTTNLGNGMFLSAGSSTGSRSAGGSAAGGSALAGQKHSGPSVGLKLSF
jgi:hypothetical protein